jgi:MFS family permease
VLRGTRLRQPTREIRKPRGLPSRDRRLLVGEGLFSGTATAVHQSFFVPLLVRLGVGSSALGLFTAFNGLLTNVSGLAGSRVARRVPNRRVLAAVSGGLGRLGFLAIALLLLARGADTPTYALILIALVSAALLGLGTPILTSLIADSIETRERGAFFANRLLAGGAGAAGVALGVAVILRQLTFPNGFIVAYLLAVAAGIGALVSLLGVRHAPDAATEHDKASDEAAGGAPISRRMWAYAASTCVLWFGAAMVGPILTPYLLNDLGASTSFIGLQSAENALIALSIQRFWGRRIDRFGSFGVLRWCIVIVSTLPVLYALTPTYWFGLLFEIISGIGWAGFALGSLNFALELAPERERARYSALANAAGGLGAFAGPLVTAILVSFLPVRVILVLAGVVRLSAFFVMRLAR